MYKTDVELKTQVDAVIVVNGNGEITPPLDNSIRTNFIDSKINKALTDTYIFVGNGSNLAVGVAMSGQASISNTGVVTLLNSAVIGKVITGYTSGAGTVAATDTILQAIQKLNGNAVALSGTAFVTGRNSFGAIATLGTNDAYNLEIYRNNSLRLTIGDAVITSAVNFRSPTISINAATLGFAALEVTAANATTNTPGVASSYSGMLFTNNLDTTGAFRMLSGGIFQIATDGDGRFISFAPGSFYESMRIAGATSSVNYFLVTGSATGNDLLLEANGTDTDISIQYNSKGVGFHKFNNTVYLPAGTTAKSSLNIPSGAAPTSPNNGDIWSDGSDIKVRLGGVTYTLTKV
jgi:hypothetical protein